MATATRIEFYGTGKRKTAVVRVFLRPGSGNITINERTIDQYFGGHESLKGVVRQAFATTETGERFDVVAVAAGGGVTSQAEALRHGIARALCGSDIELRPSLKKAGLLSRDARIKERKKYGQKGARRRFQFSKR